MQENSFKLGDVVQLKSGGPKMTIISVPESVAYNQYGCSWFGGKKHERGHFPPEALELAKETSKD